MSVNTSDEIICPNCEAHVPVNVALSVNGGRHDHFRVGILDGSYQRYTCPGCETAFRLPPDLSYVDTRRGQWILARPLREAEGWEELEDAALELFDRSFGPKAPAPARTLGAQIQPRVVFGWPALREKLACLDHGLDDVQLELLKLSLTAASPELSLSDTVELRLLGVRDDQLDLIWVDAETEQTHEALRVPRAAYDAVADAAWDELRASMASGPYVDMGRLIVEPEAL